ARHWRGCDPAAPLHLCTTAASAVRQRSHSPPHLAMALAGRPGILSRRGSRKDDHTFIKVLAKRGNRGGSRDITDDENDCRRAIETQTIRRSVTRVAS